MKERKIIEFQHFAERENLPLYETRESSITGLARRAYAAGKSGRVPVPESLNSPYLPIDEYTQEFLQQYGAFTVPYGEGYTAQFELMGYKVEMRIKGTRDWVLPSKQEVFFSNLSTTQKYGEEMLAAHEAYEDFRILIGCRLQLIRDRVQPKKDEPWPQ